MLYLALPAVYIILIYLAAAIGPAVYLMYYIYKHDKVEPEPGKLLWQLVLCGVLAAFCSIVLETVGIYILDMSPIDPSSKVYIIILAFFVVAVVEEGTKYFWMHRKVWKNPAFNYRFDAIVYSAFTSLGFAAFENVEYVTSYGLSVAFPRAILSIPGHLGFSVMFGYFYGRAKLAYDRGQKQECRANMITGYVSAVAMHGFYDTCAMIGTGLSTLIFLAFVAVMYVVVIRMVKSESSTDAPV